MTKIGVISILLAAAACGGSDGGTTPQEQPASVNIAPATLGTFASLGQTATLTGQVRGDEGGVLNNVTISWTTLSSAVATVSPASGSTTTVTATGNGNTKIIATITTPNGARSDTVDVVVATGSGGTIFDVGTTGNTFVNGSPTIRVGDRVRFTIQITPHNVLFDSNRPVEGDIGAVGAGVPVGTVEIRTFNAAGVSNYHCSIHSGMTASITVTP